MSIQRRPMTRIAIVGGGISGLTAAYELECARRNGAALDWQIYEASNRLGGIIETTRLNAPDGEYILEGGPESWVSEKPWLRELAVELGLENELIFCNEDVRRTYIVRDGELLPVPDGMRMMVPQDLSALEGSPLFTPEARRAYAAELTRAKELKISAPVQDESVASFVERHFGPDVLATLAAPLLSGVFGGDVHKLSVRAVMPQFVAMERDYGSLIDALQARSRNRGQSPQPIFTSFRRGMATLVEALVAQLPPERLHLDTPVAAVVRSEDQAWQVRPSNAEATACDVLLLATSLDATRRLLGPLGEPLQLAASLLPRDASSAVLAAFTWPAELTRSISIPPGFGFLVPQADAHQLLAGTFVDQKFPHRAPAGARILRAFFGSAAAARLEAASDEAVAVEALKQLRSILGPLPEPAHTLINRWPRSLPQYEPGHLERLAQLDELVSRVPCLHLLGNSYRGVGLPDLVRDARTTARALAESIH